MGRAAAHDTSGVLGIDVHTVVVPASPPAPLPHTYAGKLGGALVSSVLVEGKQVATVGSIAKLDTPHLPTSPGTAFVVQPNGDGTVSAGSSTVFIGGQGAARVGDAVVTCSESGPAAQITTGASTVYIG